MAAADAVTEQYAAAMDEAIAAVATTEAKAQPPRPKLLSSRPANLWQTSAKKGCRHQFLKD